MRPILLLTALALASPAAAKFPPLPRMSAAELVGYLPQGGTLEVRMDADVTGDGLKDVVAVGKGEDVRKLVVLAGYQVETDMGYRPVGQMDMDPSPLGDASLKVQNGVLLIEDLTGGTTAVSSLYRFRYDRAADRMRLIGDDVELYSRTWAHDGLKVSTNRLTGVQIRTANKLVGHGENASYAPAAPVTRRISRAAIYMEEAPDPADTVGLGG